MKKLRNHIALLLLLLLGITFIPFNALHHHAEDEHQLTLLRHKHIPSSHHCELDDLFCQPIANEHCAHPSHIAKTIGKCFTCEFHFVKQYTHTEAYVSWHEPITLPTLCPALPGALGEALILLSNKGPPSLSTVI